MERGTAPAVLAQGRKTLSYADLAAQTRRLAGQLRASDIRPGDRLAIVLPNGPEAATAFLAVASCASCAPLNPNYIREDFEFYLNDLRAKAVLVDASAPAAVLNAARTLGVRVLRLEPQTSAGEFTLADLHGSVEPDWLGEEETALLLHTSGTTSRPKLVPLTARNLAMSAANIAGTLALSPADRCLNIMPLFHIHGLMAAVLATVHAGASVVCTDGVFASQFFAWLAEFEPTWYTAVPTMHQGILARAAEHSGVIGKAKLRFIRSSSAPLPPLVMKELERTFRVPLIEAYGMTEAAHQMASNPLPPGVRKPGSVGRAAGPEIAIMNDRGDLLGAGETGEVVIRGANVTPGYKRNAAANEAAFTGGWFRTGDQGRMDEDGYLYLTGRLKELINRGGEKIAPKEVDEMLLEHPAVRQAVTFAVPHAQLGEDVAAAVELRSGQLVSESELQAWAAERLPAFKVPRLIRFVDRIPKGPTGKIQRVGLAGRLGIERLDDARPGRYVAPRNELEEQIAAIWRNLFPGTRIGVEDRFEALGGDSLLAARMLNEVGALVGTDLSYQQFVREGTIASLAQAVVGSQGGREVYGLVTLKRGGSQSPLVCVPGHDGSLLGLARMAAMLKVERPVWAFELSRFEETKSIAELARLCVERLRRRQPIGPYALAGVCFGGCLALEMAQALAAQGERVEFLCLIDILNPAWRRSQGLRTVGAARVRQLDS
ncbi:MAG: AMP-binding protein [Bryobacteraceae bacterium]